MTINFMNSADSCTSFIIHVVQYCLEPPPVMFLYSDRTPCCCILPPPLSPSTSILPSGFCPSSPVSYSPTFLSLPLLHSSSSSSPSSFLSLRPSSLSTPYPLHPLPASTHLFIPPSESGSARFNAEQMARTVQARIEANRTSQGGSSHGPNIYAREPNRLLSFYVGNLTWVRGQAAWN